jgi:plastocyanin
LTVCAVLAATLAGCGGGGGGSNAAATTTGAATATGATSGATGTTASSGASAATGPTATGSSGEATGATASVHATCDASRTVAIVAKNILFDTDCLAVPAGKSFVVRFTNKDSIGHTFSISRVSDNQPVFQPDTLDGGDTATYRLKALPAGEYYFYCALHPAQMQGSFFVT